MPLYLHPGSLPRDDWHVMRGRPEMYGASWSWQAETGGHAMRLIYAGVFDRHPGATLILGHLGEFLPFQRSRFDSRYRSLQLDAPLERMPSQYFGSNILITTSGVLAPEAVQAAVLSIGAEAVMFAIDYPYESTAEAVDSIEKCDVSPEVKEKIAHLNARRVLGHLTGRHMVAPPVTARCPVRSQEAEAGRPRRCHGPYVPRRPAGLDAPSPWGRRASISAAGREVCKLIRSVTRPSKGGQAVALCGRCRG